ncbi:hypothetical protein [Novosphingobium sp.]|jgi:hypothetical protein|uniref:hypothetical protein n=1 Tax=Novosphingobium sp. TaxID=1874826 RepID=UPI002FE333A0
MTNLTVNADTSMLAATPLTGDRMRQGDAPDNWFEAFASAWGKALDNEAAKIEQQSDVISNGGGDNPSQITELTAQSLRFSFISNSSHSSLDSVGKALETMARKG